MRLHGSVKHNQQRGHWYVALRWQGQRKYFSQIPTRGDEWLECKTEEMALHLQREISREIDRGVESFDLLKASGLFDTCLPK
jgi:hypothetical protein